MIYRGQGFQTVIWLLPCIQAMEYLMIYRGLGFLTVSMIWLLPSAFPTVSSTGDRLTEKGRQGADGRGGRKEPNHTTARKPGPL
jgi:hypothetical protein